MLAGFFWYAFRSQYFLPQKEFRPVKGIEAWLGTMPETKYIRTYMTVFQRS